jgi:hypothetical protein
MKMYIRFFRNKEDGMPINSYKLGNDEEDNNTIQNSAERVSDFINGWMNQYPNGKVDFVWLSC